jgi:hypothetical protein
MNRLLFVAILLAIFLGLVAYFYKNQAEEQERLKKAYMGNNELLLERIRKVYDDKVATDSRIKELEQEAIKDKEVFDWNIDISNTNVIKRLQAN